MRLKTTSLFSGAIIAAIAGFSACYMEVYEEDDKPTHREEYHYEIDFERVPYELRDSAETCETQKYSSAGLVCVEENENRWNLDCKDVSCKAIPVHVHYMLTENLGAKSVNVEAFDNPRFSGNPVSAVRVSGFDASRPGSFAKGEIYLKPGQYYLRGYIANDDETVVPYSYQGMELVGGKPTGVFGAMSAPQTLVVKSDRLDPWPSPVNIYLDKLFKKPESETPTNATLRLTIKTELLDKIVDGRQVLIQLHQSTDINNRPLQQYQMASENLLVQGRVGSAEYVASNAPVGIFIVLVYLDQNGNRFYDDGELVALYSENGSPKAITLEANKTQQITINLKEKVTE